MRFTNMATTSANQYQYGGNKECLPLLNFYSQLTNVAFLSGFMVSFWCQVGLLSSRWGVILDFTPELYFGFGVIFMIVFNKSVLPFIKKIK